MPSDLLFLLLRAENDQIIIFYTKSLCSPFEDTKCRQICYTTNMLLNVLGWIGITCILLAYLLITAHKVERRGRLYHLLNLVGSLLLIYDAYSRGATAFLVLNSAWAAIALFALFAPPQKATKRKK